MRSSRKITPLEFRPRREVGRTDLGSAAGLRDTIEKHQKASATARRERRLRVAAAIWTALLAAAALVGVLAVR